MQPVAQRQVETWPYFLAGAITVLLVALLLVSAAFLARRLDSVRILGYTRLVMVSLAVAAFVYSIVAGPLLMLGMLAAPTFVGALFASALYRGRRRSEQTEATAQAAQRESYSEGGGRPDAWFVVLWALASAVGGALGGFGLILSFFGQLILFGLLVGMVQTFALLLHRVSGAWLWIPASFFGWILGSFVGALDYLLLPPGMANTPSLLFIGSWVSLALAQGLVLVFVVLSQGSGTNNRTRRTLPLLSWFPAGIVGGVLAGILGSFLGMWLTSEESLFGASGQGILYQMTPVIISQAVAGLIYGLATGVILMWLLRSLGYASHRMASAETDTA